MEETGTTETKKTRRNTKDLVRPYKKQEGVIYGRPVGSYTWDEQALLDLGNELIKWFEADPDNLFFQDFFISKGLYKDFIKEHSDKYKTFALIIKNARQTQEAKLVKRIVTSRYNPAGGIFVLKNYHGFADKIEHDYGQANSPTNIIINLPPNIDKELLPPATPYIELSGGNNTFDSSNGNNTLDEPPADPTGATGNNTTQAGNNTDPDSLPF